MNPPGPFSGKLERVSVVANRRAAGWLGLALIVLLSAFAAMHPIRDPDFGWHLALGRYIAEHHSVPTTEPFTHTAFGAPMVAHEWLSQLLLYGGAKSSGIHTCSPDCVGTTSRHLQKVRGPKIRQHFP